MYKRGFVDKTFISDDEEGFRLAKVRIRDERIPAIGDKMASRAGQKGTIGTLLDAEDMPYSKDGIIPDMIVNPHAFPSRMTVGQFIESLGCKLSTNLGFIFDGTPYQQQDLNQLGELLENNAKGDTEREIQTTKV